MSALAAHGCIYLKALLSSLYSIVGIALPSRKQGKIGLLRLFSQGPFTRANKQVGTLGIRGLLVLLGAGVIHWPPRCQAELKKAVDVHTSSAPMRFLLGPAD